MTRFLAAGIDAAVVVVLILAGFAVVAGTKWVLHPRGYEPPTPSFFAQTSTVLLVLVVYLTLGWVTSGRTYGCHVMGLRVVSRRGERLRPIGALLRAVFCALFPVGLFWCAISRNHRSVQDLVLRTSVIYDWSPRAPWRTPEAPNVGGSAAGTPG